MVRFCEQVTTFQHPWHEVVQAFWKKYPNPYSGHVLSEDTVHQQLSSDGRSLLSKRIITKTNRMPAWGERLLAARTVAVLEESVCQPAAGRLVTLTRNLAHTQLMTVVERVEYTVHPELAGQTLVKRQAWVTSPLIGLGYAVQAFGIDRFKKNVTKTVAGFNHVLSRMFPREQLETAATATTTAATLSPLDVRRERLREKAKKATELAKSKAGTLVAACAEAEQQQLKQQQQQ